MNADAPQHQPASPLPAHGFVSGKGSLFSLWGTVIDRSTAPVEHATFAAEPFTSSVANSTSAAERSTAVEARSASSVEGATSAVEPSAAVVEGPFFL